MPLMFPHELTLVLTVTLHRLQDSLEFIGQESSTLRPEQASGAHSLLGNIGNLRASIAVGLTALHLSLS